MIQTAPKKTEVSITTNEAHLEECQICEEEAHQEDESQSNSSEAMMIMSW